MRASTLSRISIAVATGLACLTLQVRAARAEEPFPGGLQEAAGLSCAPACTLCHTTPQGGAGTFTKALGIAVAARGATQGSGEAGVTKAWNKLVEDAKAAGATPDIVKLVNDIQSGIDPNTGEELCQITYGCGARIAKDEPHDDWSGLLFVAGAMGLGAILRRAKRR